MINHASKFRVSPDQLSQKTAEMTDFTVFYTAAAQNPPKAIKIDFFFMHCVNTSVFWPTFNALPWLTEAMKCRLLEWKGRLDLAMYVSRNSPRLFEEEIEAYTTESSEEVSWEKLAEGLYKVVGDDGHSVKLLRALGNGERVCKEFDGKVQKGQWLGIGRMAVESVETARGSGQSPWARSVGFDQAWEDVKERTGKTSL
jgi:hypothetical protein